MTENRQQRDCPPVPQEPAEHPCVPVGRKCDPIPTTTPPTLATPTPCEVACDCPKPAGPKPTCIDDLIAKYKADVDAAKTAEAFKADLADVLKKANLADQAYTTDKYNALVKAWLENDDRIADLIRKLVCSLPCWRCLIECYVCQQLEEIRIAEEYLWSPTAMPGNVQNIYDLQYWYARDVAQKDRQLQRIKGVLAAWGAPDATIDAANKANATLIDAIKPAIGNENGKAAYDLFVKLIPLHLAIAPPSDSKWKTKIAKEYTEFCNCDVGKPDDCCGPDVGVLSLRERLVGPQPYLVEPKHLFKIICCLVEQRYAPAKEALAQATAAASAVAERITSYSQAAAKIPNNVDASGKVSMPPAGWGWADKAIRPGVPSSIVCCDDKLPSDEPPASSTQTAM